MRGLWLFFFFFPLVSKGADIDFFLQQTLLNYPILESRQIKIPNYPSAYNPSLIPYENGYLLSFRYITRYPKEFKNGFRKDTSFIGLARLDSDFRVLTRSVHLLNISSHSLAFSLSAEDGRLLYVGDRIFLFFNDIPSSGTDGGYAMYFAELIEKEGIFVFRERAKPLIYREMGPVEKNWSPFVSEDKLYVIYADLPRIILEVDLDTGYCTEVSRTMPDWQWSLGEIRGGTPAYLIGDSFLTFFHSSFSKKKTYVMGAYTFDAIAPFSINGMISNPIGDISGYTENNSSKVVFPGGMVVQEDVVHVAWGKNDKQVWITTFDKKKLLSSMEPFPR